MRGAVAVVALVVGGCLLWGCGSRPASLARDLGVPVDVAEVADAPTGESTDAATGPYYAPDGALVCDVGGRIPATPPVACDDDTGLVDCCPAADSCDPCTLPICHGPCRYGLRSVFRCRDFGRDGWQLSPGAGLNLYPCTADNGPMVLDGGPLPVVQQPCNDGTGRTTCCLPGSAVDVACVLPDYHMEYSCWTPCQAGTTTELGCADIGGPALFLPGDPMPCGRDGGG
jgi:hypothetical protein